MRTWRADTILELLDACCDRFVFPMLDNGYIYPAAARLSAYRSPQDWALVIETFGFSPRQGIPAVTVSTFGSTVVRDDLGARFPDPAHRARYLQNHPHDELRQFFPLDDNGFLDVDCDELVAEGASSVVLRGASVAIPDPGSYAAMGIVLREPPRVAVFELCRALAHTSRSSVLALPDERRAQVPPDLEELIMLDDWNHPDVVDDTARPGNSQTFKLLAAALEHNDASLFKPTDAPNTHWSNWPEGGTL